MQFVLHTVRMYVTRNLGVRLKYGPNLYVQKIFN